MDARADGGAPEAARGGAIEALDAALLDEPLDYHDAEHYRLLAVLNLLENIAGGGGAGAWRRLARAVVAYLRTDLARHVADEEDLVAILIDAPGVDAAARGLIESLRRGHADVLAAAGRLARALEARLHVDAADAREEVARAAGAFITAQRARLALKGDLLMPVARARLGARQRRRLARRMAGRRAAR
ncbi:MAG: hemerythrin domain-containing protein [Rhodospirillales bacterium]|nr:MAG: hemerythrin domain-containing protein [Rhodospirillales bacterium]